jgi:phosphocarrier protein HPr
MHHSQAHNSNLIAEPGNFKPPTVIRSLDGEPRRHHRLDLVVNNQLGLHARAAAMFVRTAQRFRSDIFVQKDGQQVNGKSILGLLLLAAGRGQALTLHAHGADAPQALAELASLFQRNFEEG